MKYLLLILALALGGCGGGGPNAGTCFGSQGVCNPTSGNPVFPTTPSQPEQPSQPAATGANGIWTGTTNTGRSLAGVFLDDDTAWIFYTVAGNPNLLAGVAQGTFSVSGNTLTSSNLRDFNLEGAGVNDAQVNAMFTTGQTLSGAIRYSSSNVGFNATYSPQFHQQTSLATVAGTYRGQAVTGGGLDLGSFTVGPDGSFSGTTALNCRATGTTTPRSSGYVYDLVVTFQGGTCSIGTQTARGVAYLDLTTGRVWGAALNTGRTNGVIFLGTRQ